MKRVDDRKVLSGVVHVLKSVGRWADAPREYGSKKTLYNRLVRWTERSVWKRIFSALAGAEGESDRLMIDSIFIKNHRCSGGGKGRPSYMLLVAAKVDG
ncbi:transposase [Nitrosomonas sp. Nm33]|uniref:transposase n=1 Tax=Nitrosomonas sp. Nm33 TaxID=133724 RepID=UPI000B83A106